MKNKKALIIAIILVIASLVIGYIAANREFLVTRLFMAIDERLDYERSLDYGYDFTKISFGPNLQFEITHCKDGNNLEYVYREFHKKERHILLKSEFLYNICDNKMYVATKSGCAVIEDSGICRIYLNKGYENEFSYDCTEDKYGYIIYGFQKFEHENVIYLSDFEDFSEDEKKVLNKMLKFKR